MSAAARSWKWEGRKLQGYFAARFQAYRTTHPLQLAVKVRTDVIVEIFQATAERWEARTRPDEAKREPKRFRPLKEIRAADLSAAFTLVEGLFYNRVGDWELYDAAGLLIEPTEEPQTKG